MTTARNFTGTRSNGTLAGSVRMQKGYMEIIKNRVWDRDPAGRTVPAALRGECNFQPATPCHGPLPATPRVSCRTDEKIGYVIP